MIALATHGYSGFRRWALGSVTERVISTASVPVFVRRAREDDSPPDYVEQFQRILVPLDGSDFSREALPLAIDLARRAGASLHLMQAIESVEDQPALVRATLSIPTLQTAENRAHERAELFLTEVATEVRQQGVTTVTTNVRRGYPWDRIVEESAEQQADVIVMATHGHSGLLRWALGSVADKVLRSTDTPLLLVRPDTPNGTS
jgi:nucleotide-binding universal stress UspA family protein